LSSHACTPRPWRTPRPAADRGGHSGGSDVLRPKLYYGKRPFERIMEVDIHVVLAGGDSKYRTAVIRTDAWFPVLANVTGTITYFDIERIISKLTDILSSLAFNASICISVWSRPTHRGQTDGWVYGYLGGWCTVRRRRWTDTRTVWWLVGWMNGVYGNTDYRADGHVGV